MMMVLSVVMGSVLSVVVGSVLSVVVGSLLALQHTRDLELQPL
jgi:putative Ca2+/H+ antiporter (TMEM165/GDT1 family)